MLINFQGKILISSVRWPTHHFIIHEQGSVYISSRNQIIVLNRNIAHRLRILCRMMVGINFFVSNLNGYHFYEVVYTLSIGRKKDRMIEMKP